MKPCQKVGLRMWPNVFTITFSDSLHQQYRAAVYTSSIMTDNIHGYQFHPWRSHGGRSTSASTIDELLTFEGQLVEAPLSNVMVSLWQVCESGLSDRQAVLPCLQTDHTAVSLQADHTAVSLQTDPQRKSCSADLHCRVQTLTLSQQMYDWQFSGLPYEPGTTWGETLDRSMWVHDRLGRRVLG